MQDKELKQQIDALWRVRILTEVSQSELRVLQSTAKYSELKNLYLGHGGNGVDFDNSWGATLDRASGSPLAFLNPTE